MSHSNVLASGSGNSLKGATVKLQELKRGAEDFLLFTRDRNYRLVDVACNGQSAKNRPPKARMARQFAGLQRIDDGCDRWKVTLRLEDGTKHGLTCGKVLRSVDHRHIRLVKEEPATAKQSKRVWELNYTHANE